MEYSLTSKVKHAVHCSDNKDRNILCYYLNGVLIFKQKIPFDPTQNSGNQYQTRIKTEYLLNGKIYQTRSKLGETKTRLVSFPVSKKVLSKFNIPLNFKITLNN